MKLAIIDDLKHDIDRLKNIISEYFDNIKETANIDCYFDGESFLKDFSEKKYDVVFIDIYMNKISGIEIARKIFSFDKNCKIVFITTSNNFAAESYEVKAYSYIIKPVSYSKISSIFDNLMTKKTEISLNVDLIAYKSRININLNHILYIDIISRTVNIHLLDNILPVKGKFSDYKAQLLEYSSFIECFRGVIVNMEHIENISKNDFILDNGETVPIRKRYGLDIRKRYMKYRLNKI